MRVGDEDDPQTSVQTTSVHPQTSVQTSVPTTAQTSVPTTAQTSVRDNARRRTPAPPPTPVSSSVRRVEKRLNNMHR